MDAGPSDADAAGSALAAIQLNDWNDFNGLEDDAAEIRRRAYEMERRADGSGESCTRSSAGGVMRRS